MSRRHVASVIALLLIVMLLLVALFGRHFGLYLRFSEPEVHGTIIDKVTRKPIHGAVIYGYYALEEGLYHGSRITAYVHNFEAVTDEKGHFKLPAWGSNNWLQWGVSDKRFPSLRVYMPGYEVYANGFATIFDWSPSDAAYGLARGPVKNGVLDWTDYPVELSPVKSDYYRFLQLGFIFRGVGDEDCSWKTHQYLYTLAHIDLHQLKEAYIPKSQRDAQNFPVANWSHNGDEFDNRWVNEMAYRRSGIDDMLVRDTAERLASIRSCGVDIDAIFKYLGREIPTK
jgi:hypothetical protein